MRIQDRYASAIYSPSLLIKKENVNGAVEILASYAIADRRLSAGEGHFSKHPLAVPLERLFCGDSSAAPEIIRILSESIRGKANALRVRMTEVQASDMARVVLGWFRHPACQVCGGHGFKLIRHTTTLGDSRCRPCNGTGRVQLELAFRVEQREIVAWAIACMERESAMAGPAAMRALAPTLAL